MDNRTTRQIARIQNRIAAGERQRERIIADRKASIYTAREAQMLLAALDSKLAEARSELAALENG